MTRLHVMTLMASACLMGGCPRDDCAPSGTSELSIGQGVGDEFSAFNDGDALPLSVAPQGGFGVSVRAQTLGLVADAPVSVLMETYKDGALAGSFLNDSVQLFCQDDGAGMLWGIVVGFDPDVYSTNDDLLELDGETVTLEVTATDEDGVEAVGSVDILIDVGG